MAFAFIHLITAWLAGKSYEHFSKNKLDWKEWFLLLLGGILPDIDLLIDWTFKTDLHRTLTHSFLFVPLAVLLAYLIFRLIKEPQAHNLAILLGCGILVHILIDLISTKGVPLLWPNQLHFTYYSIGPYLSGTGLFTPEILVAKVKMAIIDMAAGTAWIFYLLFRKRIRF